MLVLQNISVWVDDLVLQTGREHTDPYLYRKSSSVITQLKMKWLKSTLQCMVRARYKVVNTLAERIEIPEQQKRALYVEVKYIQLRQSDGVWNGSLRHLKLSWSPAKYIPLTNNPAQIKSQLKRMKSQEVQAGLSVALSMGHDRDRGRWTEIEKIAQKITNHI